MTEPMLHTVDVDSDAGRSTRRSRPRPGRPPWTSDCDIEPVVGSIARSGFPGAPVDLRMKIDELEPWGTIRWSCLGDFPIGPARRSPGRCRQHRPGAGTAVAFTHDGWKADYPDDEVRARAGFTRGAGS